AGDLLPQFAISTKIGFFPYGNGAAPSLDPARLRQAVHESVDDLGVRPEVIFLHSPERTLATLPPKQARDSLASACAVLTEAAATGLCGSWGITSWDPRPLLSTLRFSEDAPCLVPDILMVRAGLTVGSDILDASEDVAALMGVAANARWGMSPFGGGVHDEVWATTNIRTFLRPGQECSNLQATFRVAYDLPSVSQLAVGTNSATHLGELANATRLQVDADTISRYRQLIRAERS
ncbi:MAG: aldo/keto reductase, partial [Pseudonocardiaceae bacterium]